MDKVICPICKKKFINQEFLNKHIKAEHPQSVASEMRKGWRTPYGFFDGIEPVSYEYACSLMQQAVKDLWGDEKAALGVLHD